MAPPYLFTENFERNGFGNFITVIDSLNRFRVLHYTQIAAIPSREVPYSGAFCAALDLAPGVAAATASGSLTAALGTNLSARLYVMGEGLVLAPAAIVTIFSIQGVVATTLNGTATGPVLTTSLNGAGGATSRSTSFEEGVWHSIEADMALSATVGTITVRVDRQQLGEPITGLVQSAATTISIGAAAQSAGVTAGRLFFDGVVAAATPPGVERRYGIVRQTSQNAHLALGPGQLEEVALTATDAPPAFATADLYDTDAGDLSSPRLVGQIQASAGQPSTFQRIDRKSVSLGTFTRGVYAVLTGTNPELTVSLRHGAMSAGEVKTLSQLYRTR